MRKFLISSCSLLLASSISHGSLLLNIDANTGSFSWSVSGTGANGVEISQFVISTFFLANKSVLDPNPLTATAVTEMADTLTLSTIPVPILFEETLTPINPGQINVDVSQNLFSINLGTFYADMGSPTISLNADVIDSSLKTYSGFTPAEKTFLSSLEGSKLNLYQVSGGTVSLLDVSASGGSDAVQLNVTPIPEPSSSALLGVTLGIMTFRRRRVSSTLN